MKHATNAGVERMPLTGFRSVMWPTCLPVKLRYDDYRVLTAVGNEAFYTYRLNSLFDPDQSGAGAQPEGFDQLKTLYGRYRVIAAKCTVEAQGNGANTNGFVAMAPIDNSSLSIDAESLAALRYGVGKTFSQTESARMTKTYHIGDLLGYSDEAVLGNSNLDAAISASPSFQQYLMVQVETGNSATGQTMIRVQIEFYARMEVPIAVEDAVRRRASLRRECLRKLHESSGATCDAPSLPAEPLSKLDPPATSSSNFSLPKNLQPCALGHEACRCVCAACSSEPVTLVSPTQHVLGKANEPPPYKQSEVVAVQKTAAQCNH